MQDRPEFAANRQNLQGFRLQLNSMSLLGPNIGLNRCGAFAILFRFVALRRYTILPCQDFFVSLS
jgi:hypothetical protein